MAQEYQKVRVRVRVIMIMRGFNHTRALRRGLRKASCSIRCVRVRARGKGGWKVVALN